MSDLLKLYNESWSEDFDVDVDASKSIKVHVAPKTYAMLVQIGVFNIHSRGIVDWVSKVDVEAIYMNLDFSVDMLLQNYYTQRSGNKKSQNWSEQMASILEKEARPHMRKFLEKQGFKMK